MHVCLKVCDMYVHTSGHGEFPAVLVLYCMCINVSMQWCHVTATIRRSLASGRFPSHPKQKMVGPPGCSALFNATDCYGAIVLMNNQTHSSYDTNWLVYTVQAQCGIYIYIHMYVCTYVCTVYICMCVYRCSESLVWFLWSITGSSLWHRHDIDCVISLSDIFCGWVVQIICPCKVFPITGWHH